MTTTNDSGGADVLGPRIAVGRTSEVFAFGDGRVLKLLLPAFERLGEHEAAVAALVARVYPGAPACLGTVMVDGRWHRRGAVAPAGADRAGSAGSTLG